MHSSKMTKVSNKLCIFLMILPGVFRLPQFRTFTVFGTLIYAVLLTAALMWTVQIRQRLTQPEERKYLTWAGYMIVLFLALRTLKYQFVPANSLGNRYVWYLYYLPQTFLPLLMFFAVLHIGKPIDQPVQIRWKLLYLPAALLVLGVLTNEWHHLAFAPLDGWVSDTYRYGPLYFAVVLWMVLLFVGMLIIALKRCAAPATRRNLWMPILPLLFGTLYTVLYILNPNGLLPYLYKMPEVACFVCAAFLECLIQAHLLPTNDDYADLWHISDLGGGIMDYNGVLCYPTRNTPAVTKDQVLEAEKHPIRLPESALQLNSHAVSGGWGYWTTDMTEIDRLNQQLEELGDVLAEENAMLEGENDLKERRLRIEQKAELYDSIERDVAAELLQVRLLLAQVKKNGTAPEKTLKQAAVLTAYIKRRCNLLLLSHQQELLSGRELRLALTESLEYIHLYGVETCGEYGEDTVLPAAHILLAYRLFETAVEIAFDRLEGVFVNLQAAGGLKLNLELAGVHVPENLLTAEIADLGGTLTVTQEDGAALLHLRLPEGGAAE